MKISKKALVVIIGLLIYAPSALALKRAPFPNSTPLQPIPANVQPNISANVNSDTSSASNTEQAPGAETTEVPSMTTPQSSNGLSVYFYLGIGAGLLTVIVVRYFLKKRE